MQALLFPSGTVTLEGQRLTPFGGGIVSSRRQPLRVSTPFLLVPGNHDGCCPTRDWHRERWCFEEKASLPLSSSQHFG